MLFFLLAACTDKGSGEKQAISITGTWSAELLNKDGKPSVKFEILMDSSDQELKVYFVNAEEKLPQEVEWISSDSLRIRSLYFDSWIDLAVQDSQLSGIWYNRYRSPDYSMPFVAHRNNGNVDIQRNTFSVDGHWRVVFSPGSEDAEDAIGSFMQDENGQLTGTFMTETGDYRFLKGIWSNDVLELSTFDGSHAYHFSATSSSGDTLFGKFYSGNHYETDWIAWRDDSFSLRDPYQLTGLIDPDEPFAFSFTGLDGSVVSLSDDKYREKPVVIQIMGSWCPNCLDETLFLHHIYPMARNKGVEFVSLAFEAADSTHAIELLKRYKVSTDVPWDILYAGNNRKADAGNKLPNLEHIYSFPTTLYLGPDHKVMAIYTGFNGPGTGELYDKQSRKILQIINDLGMN